MFNEIDTSKSGEIDFFEFETIFLNDEDILTDSLLSLCFKHLDREEKEYLTSSDFKWALDGNKTLWKSFVILFSGKEVGKMFLEDFYRLMRDD